MFVAKSLPSPAGIACAIGLLFSTSAEGRLGETAIQCANRYGPPKDTPAPKILDKGRSVSVGWDDFALMGMSLCVSISNSRFQLFSFPASQCSWRM
jgi:hypothetical protein